MIKQKLLSLFVALIATGALWASNTITYTATYKLLETTDFWSEGLHTNAFNVSISSHTFSNGTGTIIFSGEITTIGDYAFRKCSGLTSVIIPNSVTTIGFAPFTGCSRLTSPMYNANCFAYMPESYKGAYTIPDGIIQVAGGAFADCSGLTSVIIPNSVTTIGEQAFGGCSGLTSVTIPNSVTSIGYNAFGGCSGLTSPVYNAHCFAYMPSSYTGAYTIPSGIKQLVGGAFYNCRGLTSITIPNSVTTIGDYTFGYCSGLTSVTIPNSVTTIGKSAFSYCSGLTSVEIPNSVTTIGNVAFENCSYLTSVTIGNSVTTIGEATFAYCRNLTSVVIPNSVITVGSRAFDGCSGLKSVTIGNSVTTIGSRTFYECRNLNSVTIGKSVATIEESAFYECTRLIKTNYTGTIADWCKIKFNGAYSHPSCHNFYINDVEIKDLVIPNGIDTIGDYAFDGCSGLTSITIPNSVTTIGKMAFCGCSGLTSITIPNSVTTIGDYAFRDCDGFTSVTIPNSVTTIGYWAFYCVNNIIYNGTATGSPWGAKCMNGYIDGYLVYSDASKTILCGCSSTATGEIVIPNSVTTIGNYAFWNCSGLTSVIIPNSVTSIAFYSFDPENKGVHYEDYFNQYVSSYPSYITCKYPITYSLDEHIISMSALLTIPSIYYEWYDEIGLSDKSIFCAADSNGKITFSNLPIGYSKTYYLYAKKGTEYVYKDEITISTKTPSLSCSSSATQTTVTLSNISVTTNESVTTFSKGIYYEGKHYEAGNNDCVVLTGIAPNHKCTLQVYGCYNGQYYYGSEKYITTQPINPTLSTSQVTPTSIYVRGSYDHGDATILGVAFSSIPAAIAPQADEGYFTGLKPNTSYTLAYEVGTKEGGIYSTTQEVTTPALELTTLTPKVVSAGKVVVAASTNISDLETNVGFEWRKYNAPTELPSSRAQAILYKGQMEGILHNLSLEYWKVRAYYEAADGTCYYGEWATFDPSQPAYFEPTVHTYALVTDPTANKVQIRGYVMTGTDDVTEQGFEYWFKGAKAPRRVASATPDSVYRVQASGQVMTAVLEDLAYSTTYTCRAYAVAGGKTYYGEEVQFLTPEDPRPIYTLSVTAGENGSVNTDVSGQYREGETVTLTATAEQGFRFVQWSDGNTDNPRQLTITANTELVAFFELADGLEQLQMNQFTNLQTYKLIIDNQLFIFRGDKIYNAAGGRVK